MRDIDEKTIKGLAKAASECGIEEFVIDDGWQLNIDSPDEHPEFMGDWEIDKQNEKKITFFYTGEMEYGFFRGLNFVEKNEYLIRVGYTNLSDTEFNDMIEYIKTEGLSHHIG